MALKNLPCHVWGMLVGNGCRKTGEVVEMCIPQALAPGSLGLHRAPLSTRYIILGPWLNLTKPWFCNIEIIVAALLTFCYESVIK